MEEELNENIDSQLTDSLAIENNNYQFNNVVTNEYNSSEAPPENYTNISGNTKQTPFAIENLVTGDPYTLSSNPIKFPTGDISSLSDDEKKQRDQQYLNSFDQALANETYKLHDANQWSNVYKYNSGPNSTTFYDRYVNRFDDTAYNIDFHPLRDNEAALNLNSSWFEDNYYAWGGFVNLALAGFTGTFQSLGKMMSGDFTSPDPVMTRAFQETTSQKFSSKDNIGSFVNNLIMNFGYTAGIFATIGLENMVGGALAAQQLGKFGVAMKQYKSLIKAQGAKAIDNAVDGSKVYSENLTFLNKMENAKKYFQGWNLKKITESTLGRAANPFSNLTAYRYAILEGADDITGLASTSGGFGAFYRDLRNINLAIAESRLEAGLNKKDVFDHEFAKHYLDKGRAPNREELDSMLSLADAVSWETSLMNTGLIYITNKLAFDNILNPRRLGNIFKSKIKNIASVGKGEFGEVGRVVMEKGKGAVFKERGWRTWLDGWKTDPLSKSLGGTIGYFKVNVLEGFQESMQEVIAQATKKHYLELYRSDPARKKLINKSIVGKDSTPMSGYASSLGDQFSAEGASIFASGFFMGFLSKGLASGINGIRTNTSKIFDPAGFKDYTDTKTEIAEQLADRINSIDLKDFVDSQMFDAATQSGVAFIQNNGDIKESKDAEVEAIIEHIHYLKRNDVLDLYIENFKSYQGLSDEEFLEAFPKIDKADIQKYKSKIPGIITRVQKINNRIDQFDKKYPNPINFSEWEDWMFNYDQAVLMNWSWNESKKQAVFYEESWDDVNTRMISIYDSHYKERPEGGLSKSDSDLILTIRDGAGMKSEIARLKTEVNALINAGTPESKESAKEKRKRFEDLSKYYETWQEFDEYFHRDRYRTNARIRVSEANLIELKDVTEEQIDEVIKAEFKVSDKRGNDLLLKLRKEYKSLITSLGKESGFDKTDFVFNEDVEKGFELVIDFYKLSDEKAALVPLINFMNDPGNFMKVYEENMKWMQELYDNRGEVAVETIKKEFGNIESEGLLNILADNGIFMAMGDFIAWRDYGIPPVQFYDQKNKMVITEDSPLYKKYIEKVQLYQMFQSQTENMIPDGKYKEYLAKLEKAKKQKDEQIKKEKQAFKEANGVTVEEFEKQNSKEVVTDKVLQKELDNFKKLRKDTLAHTDTLTFGQELVSQLEIDNETWDAVVNSIDQSDLKNQKLIADYGKTAKLGQGISKEEKKIIQDQFGLYKIAMIEILDNTIEKIEGNLKTEIVSEFDQTETGAKYTKSVKKIEDQYAEIITKIEGEYTTEEKTPLSKEEKAEKQDPIISVVSEWVGLDTELQNILTETFDKILVDELNESLELKTLKPEQYKTFRDNWLKTPKTKTLINKYYSEKKANEATTIDDIEVPTLEYFQEATLPRTVKGLRTVLDKLEELLGNDLSKKERAAVKSDIKTITKYRNAISKVSVVYQPSERNYRLFEEMVLGKQDEVERIIDELTGETIGYKFTNTDPNTGLPTRVTQHATALTDAKYKREPFMYSEVKEKVEDFKTGEIRRGYLLNIFDAVNTEGLSNKEKTENFIQALTIDIKGNKLQQLNDQSKLDVIRNALEKDFTIESLKTATNKVAFVESTIAGNIVDILIRDGLTLNKDGKFVIPTKPESVSQEAFDALFGGEGIVTELQNWAKDGDFYFYVGNALIFDKTALGGQGVVGAMDILAFNKKTNEIHIIDVKTSKKFSDFNEEKLHQYAAQQSIYRNLLYNMTGIMPTQLALLPIKAEMDLKGNIKTLERAGIQLNDKKIKALKADITKLEKQKNKETQIESLEKTINKLEKSIAVSIPYTKDVEEGVPAIGNPEGIPTDLLDTSQQVSVLAIANILAPALAGPITVIPKNELTPEQFKYYKKNKEKIDTLAQKIAQNLSETGFDPFLSSDLVMKFKNYETALEIEKLAIKITNAKTVEEAEKAYKKGFMLVLSEPLLAKEINPLLEKVYEDKKAALENSVEKENLGKGMYLQSENAIFKNDIGPTFIYVIDKIGIDDIKIKQIGQKRNQSDTFSFETIEKNFTKATDEQAEESIKVTQEVKEAAKKSKENQTEFNKENPVEKSKESKKSERSIEDILKEHVKKNSKKDC